FFYPYYHAAAVGSLYFFEIDDSASGVELWRSDGTDAGTYMLSDINPGSQGSYPKYLIPVGGLLYFAACDNAPGVELWRTDGTIAGTLRLTDLADGGGHTAVVVPFSAINGEVLFRARDTFHSSSLWASDGTVAGTVIIRDGVVYRASMNQTAYYNP